MLAQRRAFVVPEHTKTLALSVLRVGFARFNHTDGWLVEYCSTEFVRITRKKGKPHEESRD